MKIQILFTMASAFTLFIGCSNTKTLKQNHSSITYAPAHIETISCIVDSNRTSSTAMYGFGEQDLGIKILDQAMLIELESDRHIHVVFPEGGELPMLIEQGVYELRGEFKIHNPTPSSKPKKYPIANYQYFLVTSWKQSDQK